MNRSLNPVNLIKNLDKFYAIRTVFNPHLVHPKGDKTIK